MITFLTPTPQTPVGTVTILYGPAGALKSTTLSQAKRPVIGQYALRGGLTRLAATHRIANLTTTADLLDFKEWALTPANKNTYDTIGLDDIDLLILDEIGARKANATNLYRPYTDTYDIANTALHALMALKYEGKNIIITAGDRTAKTVTRDERGREIPINQIRPNFPTAFYRELSRTVDIIAYCAPTPDGPVKMLTHARQTRTAHYDAKATLGLTIPEVLTLHTDPTKNQFTQYLLKP